MKAIAEVEGQTVSTATWLHISDLHWRESEAYEANVVAQALLRDLANRIEIAPCLEHIDFIFMTGDIAFASKPEEYALAQRFLKDLRRTTRVRKDHLFVIPGNHDVDRGAISDEARDIVSKCAQRSAVNELLGHEVHRAVIMQRFHRYQEFVNSYFGKGPVFNSAQYSYVKRRKIAGNRWAAILGLNSVWASASDADRLNLLLGERQVRAALDQAKRADVRIALMHHPFDWLQDSDHEACEPLLLGNCDFVLHGHLHRTGLTRLQAPGSDAMVIGAGACYETREYPNAYNLVHLDFDSGKGTVYLRMYSDRQGGFWTKDLLTYHDAPGEYAFELPRKWSISLPVEPPGDTASAVGKGHEVTADTMGALHPAQQTPSGDSAGVGLDKWWKERGYNANPFTWSNAEDVVEKNIPQLFHLWHVDPNVNANLEGLGPTPTLDRVKSPDTSRLVLIFAPGGGGKTFYFRWATQQAREGEQHALEVCDIGQHVRIHENSVTAWDLAACIHDHVCERFSIPKDLSPHEHTRHILSKCSDALGHLLSASPEPTRVYVFVDDIDQLFDEQPSGASRNAQALTAIAELCRAIAKRRGGGPLALRIFIPQQLMAPLRNRLLELIHRRRIAECAISWTAAHCQAVIERRLDSRWNGGPNTGIKHISRLLTQDARDEFREWLQNQEGISPGRVVEILYHLADCAYSSGVATEPIGIELWKQFSMSDKCTALCTPDAPYPGI